MTFAKLINSYVQIQSDGNCNTIRTFLCQSTCQIICSFAPLPRTTRLELPSAQARTQSLPSKLQQREPLKLRPALRCFKLINLILKA